RLSDLVSQEITHMEMVIADADFETLRRVLGPNAKITQSGSTLRLEVEAITPLAPVIHQIERTSGKVFSINPIRQTMEDYFLKLVRDNGGTKKPRSSPAVVD